MIIRVLPSDPRVIKYPHMNYRWELIVDGKSQGLFETRRQARQTSKAPFQGKMTMNEAQLEAFRQIAASMNSEPTDWQWNGQYLSQQHYGITETRAKSLVARHGGVARQMTTIAASK